MRGDSGGEENGILVGREVARQDGEVSQQSAATSPEAVATTGGDVDVGQRHRVPRIPAGGGRDRRPDLLRPATPPVAARQQRKHERTTATVLAETHVDGEPEPTSVRPNCPQDQHATEETTWLSQPVTTYYLSVALGG